MVYLTMLVLLFSSPLLAVSEVGLEKRFYLIGVIQGGGENSIAVVGDREAKRTLTLSEGDALPIVAWKVSEIHAGQVVLTHIQGQRWGLSFAGRDLTEPQERGESYDPATIEYYRELLEDQKEGVPFWISSHSEPPDQASEGPVVICYANDPDCPIGN